MPDIDGAWLALIGTIFGGAGLKVVEAWLGNRRQKQDHGALFREEQRKEIESLRAELLKAKTEELRLEAEVEAWRTKYYDQFVTITAQSTDLTLANSKITSLQQTLDEMKSRLAQIENSIDTGPEQSRLV